MSRDVRVEYSWQGGHPSGNIGFSKDAWIVRFNDGTRKSFHIKKYGEEAEKLAKEWQIKTSLEKGLTKNQYRRIEDTREGIYYEMKLQGDFIAKIDECDLHLATKCVWSAAETHKSVYHMAHSGKKSENIPPQRFHRLVCPLFKEVDHYNRNGLDNRRINLRNGTGTINRVNQSKRVDNKSDKTGVHYSKYDNCWVVQYPYLGRRVKKSFSVNKYGDVMAKVKAVAYREAMDVKLGLRNGYEPEEKFCY